MTHAPLMITVAGIGAEVSREQQPALPLTPEEIAADAVAVREAGASIYHLHVRDDDGRPTMSVAAFAAAKSAIEEATDLIIQFSSGGAVTDTEEDRSAPLSLGPEMASLTTGTVNFGDDVFLNPAPLVRRFYSSMRELGILPEFEIFEPGMIATAEKIYRELGDEHHQHFDLVLGVPGAMPVWRDSISFLADHLPDGATWSATGIGRSHLDVVVGALDLGGHVRTGFEDAIYLSAGRLATSNAELVRRVAALAADRGRELATPGLARQLLGLG